MAGAVKKGLEQAGPSPDAVKGTMDSFVPPSSASKEKGPVEEVILRRMKVLHKRILRLRETAAKDVKSLNEDQRAALDGLKGLETAYKELEDLVKPGSQVEEVELFQASRLREAKREAEQSALALAASTVTDYASSLVRPLSLFLRLHTLLHPARSDDPTQLTFGHLALPENMQDEVQATDVLRVGRMYEDLIGGGEEAKVVLSQLTGTPTGDAEDDRVFVLMDLLEQAAHLPPDSAPGAASDTADAEGDVADEPMSGALPNGHAINGSGNATIEPTAVEEPGANAETAGNGAGGALNFLQEDELGGDEDSYEFVAPVEDQAVAAKAFDPELLRGPSPDSGKAEGTTSSAEPMPTTPPSMEVPRNLDWATMEDDDEPLQPVHAVEEKVLLDGKPAIAVSQEVPVQASPIMAAPTSIESDQAITAPPTATEPELPGSVVANGVSNGLPTRPTKGRGRGRGRGSYSNNGYQRTSSDQAKVAPVSQLVKGQTLVDEDGFEMKVSHKQAMQTTQSRGRGGGRGRGRGLAPPPQGRGRGGPMPNGDGSRHQGGKPSLSRPITEVAPVSTA